MDHGVRRGHASCARGATDAGRQWADARHPVPGDQRLRQHALRPWHRRRRVDALRYLRRASSWTIGGSMPRSEACPEPPRASCSRKRRRRGHVLRAEGVCRFPYAAGSWQACGRGHSAGLRPDDCLASGILPERPEAHSGSTRPHGRLAGAVRHPRDPADRLDRPDRNRCPCCRADSGCTLWTRAWRSCRL